MVSAAESSKFHALFSEKAALFDESVASKNVASCRTLIQESQSLLSAYSSVLPPRDLQVSRERIEQFKKALDAIKEPKKRFGFSKAAKEANGAAVQAEKPSVASASDVAQVAQIAQRGKAAFFLENHSDEQLELTDVHGEVELRNLSRCRIRISGNAATLYISELHDCQVVCDPVTSSVLIVGFRGSTLQVACQQLRIHNAENAVFRLHITSRSIIEDCQSITFGDLPPDYPASEKTWESSGLSRVKNNYKLVDDFNWLNLQEPSPNWKLFE